MSAFSPTPALRYLLEGVVIVLSILMAFGIDAWWDSRQEARRFEAYYVALEAEVAENLPRVEFTLGYARSGIEGSRVLREHLRGGWQAVSADSLAQLFRRYGAIRTLEDINTSTLDQLVATGDLDRIPDPEVRAALRQLGRELKSTQDYFETNLMEHRWSVSFPWWTANLSMSEAFRAFQPSGSWGEHRFTTDWAAMASSLEFDNLLVTRMALGAEQVIGYEGVLAALQDLTEALGSVE